MYGAWLTTPDIAAGTHRVGAFYRGMDPYAGDNAVFGVATAGGLHGSATYSGGAAGVFVDGAETGMFTGRARLTANFDVNANGSAGDATAAADRDDFMLSGRIDNFKRTDGSYLGTDNRRTPNDPTGLVERTTGSS